MFTQEMKKDLYEFFCNSSLKYCIKFVTCVICSFWSCTFLAICPTARMQEGMEKCFLQYFTKAFSVLANKCDN